MTKETIEIHKQEDEPINTFKSRMLHCVSNANLIYENRLIDYEIYDDVAYFHVNVID